MLEITPELLLQAYRIGVFPMGERRDDPKLYWLDPRLRAVLPLDGFHLPKRLARTVRSGHFEVSADAAFTETMRACAEPRPGHPESWINEPILALYGELFQRGHAHSVECRRDARGVAFRERGRDKGDRRAGIDEEMVGSETIPAGLDDEIIVERLRGHDHERRADASGASALRSKARCRSACPPASAVWHSSQHE